MSDRPSAPRSTERAVLTKSHRRCSLCFGLDANLEIKQGQIAHLDKNPKNNSEDNLCFLCLDHHDAYDTKTSQSKGLEIGEVKEYRADLYEEMEYRFHAVDVERRLRLGKQALREAAHDGLILRADSPTWEEANLWQAQSASIVKRIAGDPALFDFNHCRDGSGFVANHVDAGIQVYLNLHAEFLKELARTMDATDLIELDIESDSPSEG